MPRRVLVVAALSLGLVLPLGAARSGPAQQAVQAPARDTAPRRTGTARIRGRVLAADTGAPVRRAIVRLTSQDMREPRGTTTDADGRYDIGDVPSGSYSVLASKGGFLTSQYGAARQGDPGKAVKLGDGEVATDIDILLARGGVIAGRVLDEFGDPVASGYVRVYRSLTVGGARRLAALSSQPTNDLGQYRVFDLDPGAYYVAVQARSGWSNFDTADRTDYAPTYYPGTASLTEAQPVQVAAGQETNGIDVMLTLARTARVSGVLLDQQGRPVTASVGVTATQQTAVSVSGGGPSFSSAVRPDGSFAINGLPPGDYLLSVNYNPGPGRDQMQYGRARVTVAGSDITGLTIQMTGGATLSGQVIFAGASVPQHPKMMVMGAFSSIGPDVAAGTGQPAQVREDGSFTLTGVVGERLIRVSGVPSGWTLKAVLVGGRDVTDTPMTFEGNERVAGIQIVLTDRLTHLTGTVTDERGQPAETAYVAVFADDPAKWMGEVSSRFVRHEIVRAETPMKINGMPPGDYVVVALNSIQNLDLGDPDVLDRLRKAGVRVTLREGENRAVALKIVDPGAR